MAFDRVFLEVLALALELSILELDFQEMATQIVYRRGIVNASSSNVYVGTVFIGFCVEIGLNASNPPI